jgi:hypothetical protein
MSGDCVPAGRQPALCPGSQFGAAITPASVNLRYSVNLRDSEMAGPMALMLWLNG